MPKKSTKTDKNPYFKSRDDMGLTREQAEEVTYISKDRLYNIENKNAMPTPDEVVAMAKAYKNAALCNYYCAKECAIGINQEIPEIKAGDLAHITLGILSSLISVERDKDKLISITADGIISEDEMADFNAVRENLDKISFSIDALKLWVNQAISEGKISPD